MTARKWYEARPSFWVGIGVFAFVGLFYAFRDKVNDVLKLGPAKPTTPLTRAQWTRRIMDAFNRVVPTMPEPYRSAIGPKQREILVAQAGIESGFGVGKASREGRNHWNLTAGSYWRGKTLKGGDLEYNKEGTTVKKITQTFRAYDSDDEGAADMLKFIGPSTRYKNAWAALLDGDLDKYLAELRAAGFYTAPLAEYTKSVNASMKNVATYLAATPSTVAV